MTVIDVSLVSRLVRSQFPEWSDLRIDPVQPSGWDNRMFRLGSQMAIRLPSAGAYAAQIEKEHRWLPRLARGLSLPIPVPLRLGRPASDFPLPWSIYRWLDGQSLTEAEPVEPMTLAEDLASFLQGLRHIDTSDGPVAGKHNFHRGGSLRVYDAETRQAIAALAGVIDGPAVTNVWNDALSTVWEHAPVWVHGDVAAGNLLVKDGRLSAVIDFGCLGVGDPACDLVMAWTFFEEPCRERFRLANDLDAATWRRAKGWALWKALITLAGSRHENANEVVAQRSLIATLLTSS